MKKTYLIFACVALAFSNSINAQSVSTVPVGYVTLTVKGTGGQGSAAYSYLGVPMHHPANVRTAITAKADNSLTSANAGWTVDAFANTHYVMIMSGAHTGKSTTIIANTADTLTTADDISAVLNGNESIAVHKYTTIADVFGAANEAGLNGSDGPGTSDNILIQTSSNSFSNYYYKNSGIFGGTGWRSSASNSIDASGAIIPYGAGIIVVRRETADLSITVSGSVFPDDAVTPVEAGYNWKSASIPLDVTLAGFFGATNEAGLDGGDGPGTADNILAFDASGNITTYYYKDSGVFGGTGWRSSASNSNDEANTVIAKPGEMFLINRSGGAAFNFTENSPLN